MSDKQSAKGPVPCQLDDPPHPLPNILHWGSLNLLCGLSGAGKSALNAQFTRDLYQRRLIFGHQPNPVADVAMVTADRAWALGSKQWFERVGFPEIRYYSLYDDLGFDPRRLHKKFDRAHLALDCIDKLKLPPYSYICLDTIGGFVGGNLLSYDDVLVASMVIGRGLMQRKLAGTGLAHNSKFKADPKANYVRPQDRILGTAALAGHTCTQMVLLTPEETGEVYYQFSWHSHLAKSEVFYLEKDEQGLFVPYSGSDQGNCSRVLLLFPDDGAEVETKALVKLAAAIPLSRATLMRVLGVLLDRQRIEKVGWGAYRKLRLF